MPCPQTVEAGWEYAREVAAGNIPAGEFHRKACQRSLDMMDGQHALGIYFDDDAALRPVTFAKFLRHLKGPLAGQPIQLEAWQIWIISQIYGWMRSSDNLRLVRTAYIEVPRKNGKSTICSILGLYGLVADGEASAEVYSAATSRDQARIVFDDASAMAVRTPHLASRLEVTKASLANLKTNSVFKPLSADAGTLEGKNPSCSIVDELHVHKTSEVYDVLDVAAGARAQPILFAITTAGTNKQGICYEKRDYVTKLLDGHVEDLTFFGVIFHADKDDDWRERDTWIKANPNYGVSVQPDDLERLCKQAQEAPAAETNFRTKRLNEWRNATEAWISSVDYEKCNAPRKPIEAMQGRDCYIGLDLASVSDFASMCLLFPVWEADTLWYHQYLLNYLPEDTVYEKAGAMGAQYRNWVENGFVKATPGNVTDLAYIKRDLQDALEKYNVREVAYDPYGATELSSALLDEGAPMVKMSQTIMSLSDPAKELEKAIKSGTLVTGGDPVMSWMISNCVVYTDPNDNIKVRKEHDANKIDGVIATIMAIGRLKVNGGDAPNPYESRGIRTL